ncbi:MAG TPA: fumarylacetoacetase [Phycisphaerales bacterium]|nr:fumarylacetoacetase [Phycisphaerales bacterium]HMP37502.1 fumarylacetoacetase [Phycisphaerales bacterium]
MNTTDPQLRSWIESANAKDSAFPIQMLPWCSFRRAGSSELPRLGVAIGDVILEVKKCVEAGLMRAIDPVVGEALCGRTLNPLLALGEAAWIEARASVAELLSEACETLRESNRWRKRAIIPADKAEFAMPVEIGNYTDFYASLHHATNVGSMFRPDNPLMPNWKHMPVGYHGRASSVILGGTPIRRPMGQSVAKEGAAPEFGPSAALDYELELGCIIGTGNALGTRIPVGEATRHIFGYVLVNDWSARDIQRWEYQPLGPFNGKNFATSISPFVVQRHALEPFLAAPPKRAKGDPKPLPYLVAEEDRSLDIRLEVLLSSAAMREKGLDPIVVSTSNAKELYWTFAQMIAHHSSSGCNLRPGDLVASGTISGKDDDERGCLLERTWKGEKPIKLPDGTKRTWLEDGDEVIMRASCVKRGARTLSLGEVRGVVLPAE